MFPSRQLCSQAKSDISNSEVGWDAHAKTFMITKDGGYIAAGNGNSCECENGKSVGFVFRADVCQGKFLLSKVLSKFT